MFGRNKTPKPELGRRRPGVQPDTRAQSFSYYARKRSSRSDDAVPLARHEVIPRSKKEILRFLGQRFGLVVAIIATVALLISSVQVSRNPRIAIVNNTEVYRLHSDDAYRQAVDRAMKSSWTNTNKITVNSAQIVRELKQQYPEIADASIGLPVLGQRPLVYVQLTRPDLLLVTNTGGAYVLDENGRVLAPASQVNNLDSLKLPTVSDQSGLTPQVGRLLLSKGTVGFIRGVAYELQRAGIPYGQLTLPNGTQELDVNVTGRSYVIRFNTHADSTAREQAGTYLAVQKRLDAQNITPAAYIDVRLPGKAYYK